MIRTILTVNDIAAQLASDMVETPHLTTIRPFDCTTVFIRILFGVLFSNRKGRMAAWPLWSYLMGMDTLNWSMPLRSLLSKPHSHLKLLALNSSQFSDAVLDDIALSLPNVDSLNLPDGRTSMPDGVPRLPLFIHTELWSINLSAADFPEVNERCMGEDDDDGRTLRCLIYSTLLKNWQTEHQEQLKVNEQQELHQLLQPAQLEQPEQQQQEQQQQEQHGTDGR